MTKLESNVIENGRDRPVLEIENILREEISLAGPDDLEFLRSQVHDIACRIAARLGLLGGQ